MAEERLQKILSRAGIASRRAAEALILEGRVQVNGEVVRELGTKADPSKDVIRVDDHVIAEPEELVHLVLYKPERVVTTMEDPEGRASVGDLIRQARLKVYPVGRLDYDAEGALILTNDGALAHKLTHPRWGVRRTYLAKVKGEPPETALARLRAGVRLEDGMAMAQEVSFERRTPRNTWIRLVVTEGRHHLVKRLCEAVGHPVVRLYRSDYGGVSVAGMQPGEIRPLRGEELAALRKAVETEAPLPPGGRPVRRRGRPAAVRDPIYGAAGPGRPAGRGAAAPKAARGPAAGRSAPAGRGAPERSGGPRSGAPAGSGAAAPAGRLKRSAPPGRGPAARGGAVKRGGPVGRGGSAGVRGRPAAGRQGPRRTGKGPKGGGRGR